MPIHLDQFIESVTDYSSQYGSLGSISYVASNLCGPPSVFPEYGDFPGSYSMQTYGKWWQCCASAVPHVNESCLVNSPMDFVDVSFEYAVIVDKVDIYEVFNPGSVFRIWGSNNGKKWLLFWSSSSQMVEDSNDIILYNEEFKQSRIFSPLINHFDKPVNMLRIEFDQSSQEYHCGFEAIRLFGSLPTPRNMKDGYMRLTRMLDEHLLDLDKNRFSEDDVLKGVEYLCSKDFSVDFSDSPKFSNGLVKPKSLSRNTTTDHGLNKGKEKSQTGGGVLDGGYFGWLPVELIVLILKQLDLQNICRVGCTCKMLRLVTSLPILYQNLNLKSCWWMVSDAMLVWLSTRCDQLRRLDLSWCGPYESLSSRVFMEFANQCGHGLTVLHLANCQFVDTYSLYIIANNCFALEVLTLSGCDKIDQLGFGELKKLLSLRYLDLSRTKIEFSNLHVVLQSMPLLNHLKIHHCQSLDLDLVAQTVSTFNRELVSFGAWKSHGLTVRGFWSLASLVTLQEVDVGWAISRNATSITDGLTELLIMNVCLRKLFLTSYRGLNDEDIYALAIHGFSLEQLDIMGSRNVTPESLLYLLTSCRNLRLLDVSYCDQIDSHDVALWRTQYPLVSIKGGQKSHVSLI